jgi:hypothetical protein
MYIPTCLPTHTHRHTHTLTHTHRYLYFNHMNLALKDSLLTSGKGASPQLTPQTQALLLEMHAAFTGI